MPFSVDAKDYDFYVDKSASSGGDGSKEEPFQEIEDAIEEAGEEGGTQEIYIKDGRYDGGFTIGKSMKLTGESSDDVIVSGTISMDNDSEIKNLTVKGGNTAVEVVKDAEVKIEGCVIRDFEKIGIDIAPGKGRLVLQDSKIEDGNGKGVYVQKGNRIKFIDNEIKDNDEEGFDLRSDVEGTISGNYIHDNGESGIEVLVADADLMIANNTIENNGSSAVAVQFYADIEGFGDIEIEKNKMKNNSNYAIDCKNTLGGGVPDAYWSKSVELNGNIIDGNKKGAINKICHLEEEIKKKQIEEAESLVKMDDKQVENEKAKKLAEEEKWEEKTLKEEKMRQEDRIKRQNEVVVILEQNTKKADVVATNLAKVRKESKIKIFFFGVDRVTINAVKIELEEQKGELERANELLAGDYVKMSEGQELHDKLEKEFETIKGYQAYLLKKSEAVSIFGLIKALFGK